jgi:hypothetical protein
MMTPDQFRQVTVWLRKDIDESPCSVVEKLQVIVTETGLKPAKIFDDKVNDTAKME